MIKIDVRGLSCPTPVLKTKQAIKGGEKRLEIVSDSNTSMENISKYLRVAGYNFTVTEEKDEYIIRAEG